MAKIVNLNGSKHKTQKEEAIEFLSEGNLENCNKLLIMGVNDTDPDNVTFSYFYAGCEPAQLLMMIEGLKERIMYLMGYK